MAAQYICEKSSGVTHVKGHTFPRYLFEIGLASLQYVRIIKPIRESARDSALPQAEDAERAAPEANALLFSRDTLRSSAIN